MSRIAGLVADNVELFVADNVELFTVPVPWTTHARALRAVKQPIPIR
ncbi:hypothetical protein [Devriesea agamarum]|nr:hypothetical protein [Devriesea agamarum]